MDHDRITTDPAIMGGRPCIRGQRITVALVLRRVGNGMTAAQIVADYPSLEAEDVRAALLFAADSLGGLLDNL